MNIENAIDCETAKRIAETYLEKIDISRVRQSDLKRNVLKLAREDLTCYATAQWPRIIAS
jgi:hypothetical protein